MDERLVKVVVGLALECALVNRRDSRLLFSLYSDADMDRVKELHDRLIASSDHYDREVAIWLEPVIELGTLKSNPGGLVAEMRKMEFVLNTLIHRSGEAQREVNNWMNYIANAAHSLEDGFWIDAKILLSRALQSSRCPSIERLKADPSLRYEVDVLQRATASYFEEVKGYPLRLRFPEDRLNAILKVQEIMLDLMQIHYGEKYGENAEITGTPIQRMSATIRYLMDERKELEASKRELRLASEHLEAKLNKIVDKERREIIQVYNERIKEIIDTL